MLTLRNVISALDASGREAMGPGVLLYQFPDPHVRTGLLITVGVDRYTEAGRLRADDLSVRSHAAEMLADAARALSTAAAEYRRTQLPAPTRERPSPPPELIEPALVARRCAERCTAAANRVRDAPLPPDSKKAWKKLRGAGAGRLFELDRTLIGQAEYAAAVVSGVVAELLTEIPVQEADVALAAVAATLDERSRYLSGR